MVVTSTAAIEVVRCVWGELQRGRASACRTHVSYSTPTLCNVVAIISVHGLSNESCWEPGETFFAIDLC